MQKVQIGDQEYSLGFNMLSVVSAKKVVGVGFFELANEAKVGSGEGFISPQEGLEKTLRLILLGLQAKHADIFKCIEDVAAALPDMDCLKVMAEAINAELKRFLSVDASLQKRVAESEGGAKKKKRRSITSQRESTSPSAVSISE